MSSNYQPFWDEPNLTFMYYAGRRSVVIPKTRKASIDCTKKGLELACAMKCWIHIVQYMHVICNFHYIVMWQQNLYIYILYACSIIRYLYLFMHRRMYIHITSCIYIYISLCVCVWWTNLRQYIWNNDWIFCFRFCDVTQAHYTYQHYTKWTRNTYTIMYIL